MPPCHYPAATTLFFFLLFLLLMMFSGVLIKLPLLLLLLLLLLWPFLFFSAVVFVGIYPPPSFSLFAPFFPSRVKEKGQQLLTLF